MSVLRLQALQPSERYQVGHLQYGIGPSRLGEGSGVEGWAPPPPQSRRLRVRRVGEQDLGGRSFGTFLRHSAVPRVRERVRTVDFSADATREKKYRSRGAGKKIYFSAEKFCRGLPRCCAHCFAMAPARLACHCRPLVSARARAATITNTFSAILSHPSRRRVLFIAPCYTLVMGATAGVLALLSPPPPTPFHKLGATPLKMAWVLHSEAELGTGGYGKVVQATEKSTGRVAAAKIISTGRMKMTAIQKEIALMSRLKHPNIIELLGYEELPEKKRTIIYMELASNGELFSRVISSGTLREDQARPYFRELMEAVNYMHSMGVVHRDLKLVTACARAV